MPISRYLSQIKTVNPQIAKVTPLSATKRYFRQPWLKNVYLIAFLNICLYRKLNFVTTVCRRRRSIFNPQFVSRPPETPLEIAKFSRVRKMVHYGLIAEVVSPTHTRKYSRSLIGRPEHDCGRELPQCNGQRLLLFIKVHSYGLRELHKTRAILGSSA